MSPLTALSTERPTLPKIENPVAFAVGASSPLWFLFAGAAASGAAYWWLSQWSKPVNLEAEWASKADESPKPEAPLALPEVAPAPPEPAEPFVAAAGIVEAEPTSEPAKVAVAKPKTIKPPPPVPDVPA